MNDIYFYTALAADIVLAVLLFMVANKVKKMDKGFQDFTLKKGEQDRANGESIKNLGSDMAVTKKRLDDLEFQLHAHETITEKTTDEIKENAKKLERRIDEFRQA